MSLHSYHPEAEEYILKRPYDLFPVSLLTARGSVLPGLFNSVQLLAAARPAEWTHTGSIGRGMATKLH